MNCNSGNIQFIRRNISAEKISVSLSNAFWAYSRKFVFILNKIRERMTYSDRKVEVAVPIYWPLFLSLRWHAALGVLQHRLDVPNARNVRVVF